MFIKHRLIERFCLNDNLNVSLHSVCVSVQGVVLFYADNEGCFIRNYDFLTISEKNLITDLEKMTKCTFLKIHYNDINHTEPKTYFIIEIQI